MNNELVINSSPNEVVIALLENKRLVELHKEKRNNAFSVGDIYLGKVKKVMTGLNAAFVDVGYEKDAFLHYLDLGPQVQSLFKYVKNTRNGKQNHSSLLYFKTEEDIPKTGKINQIVQSGQEIMVQIAKEPISTKGPRISSEISLPGRYIVLVPFSDRISVSQKIKDSEEKERLKNLIKSIKPKNFGVIIRTVAENKKVAELDADIKDLVDKWNSCYESLKPAKAPEKLLGELDRTSAFLRDMLNASFNNINVDDPALYDEMKTYLQTIAPDKEKIVKQYKGDLPIFESFGIEKQIKSLFGKTVNLKSGAYLIIEHTEALHVIDVNSGNRAKSETSQEGNALDVNLEAATEIARQLRLRDMGGIIVVDFIDLHDATNRKLLYQKMKDEMALDKAKHTVLPPSKFGLIQITRQRVRPEMDIKTTEKCPACGGSGEVQASILLVDEIENNLRYIIQEQNEKSLTLGVHPYIEAYLTKGIYNFQIKWLFKYKRWIKIKPVNAYHFVEYRFFNAAQEEIIK
ncbi:MAG: Rne/Rng family ribonuclease [Bacteroidetes bacterium]|nr:Rne/Rng family ribonuclease [Bacteroidota bacterium]HET6244195.1 Rne/Rng family ribonuclease [Bacteroidia bacterium]